MSNRLFGRESDARGGKKNGFRLAFFLSFLKELECAAQRLTSRNRNETRQLTVIQFSSLLISKLLHTDAAQAAQQIQTHKWDGGRNSLFVTYLV